MVERSVGIRELKNRLSKYLRAVKAGQTILITDRGKSIGRLIPAGQTVEEKLNASSRLAYLSGAGSSLRRAGRQRKSEGRRPLPRC
ncbi:MAG: type II toxin-antitoxin system prevent-host-death family antitoxin [Chloroflexi bacterium]|nr:type II toxin-antitoxin system prevent-host-death family antitoxin [Chloroflexota bacterium]